MSGMANAGHGDRELLAAYMGSMAIVGLPSVPFTQHDLVWLLSLPGSHEVSEPLAGLHSLLDKGAAAFLHSRSCLPAMPVTLPSTPTASAGGCGPQRAQPARVGSPPERKDHFLFWILVKPSF